MSGLQLTSERRFAKEYSTTYYTLQINKLVLNSQRVVHPSHIVFYNCFQSSDQLKNSFSSTVSTSQPNPNLSKLFFYIPSRDIFEKVSSRFELQKVTDKTSIAYKNQGTVELAYNVSAYNVNLHITSHVLLTNCYCYVSYSENIAYSVTHITSTCI